MVSSTKWTGTRHSLELSSWKKRYGDIVKDDWRRTMYALKYRTIELKPREVIGINDN